MVQDFFTRFLRVSMKRVFTSCQKDGNDKFGSTFGFSKNKNLVSYVPKIGKSVILLSTMHSTTTIDQKLLNNKSPR
ncbi:hypothetical protein LAZ67_13000542 [Cordylochernes scorpioides]|uniref:Uncharacterized protein n=1 Tax=Cordylochernes scorpioides TaxID=51811 RepID=A0ABY6L6J1_9ARAC|nr:hypothetical protein LAZ67_13000542 [Cordylochernes scorpioides]